MSSSSRLLVVVASLITMSAQSAEFRSLRQDRLVPNHCRHVEMSHFDAGGRVEKWTFSTLGAERKGFTHEIKITRADAGFLYKVFKNNWHDRQQVMSRIRNNPALYQAYNSVIDSQADFTFDWKVEGEILEAVAMNRIQNRLPHDLFVTGGITYSKSTRSRILGEIDIWVAEKDTCKVVQVGEVKLNTRLLRKAKEQLRRFSSFIIGEQNHQQGDSTRFQWPWEGDNGQFTFY